MINLEVKMNKCTPGTGKRRASLWSSCGCFKAFVSFLKLRCFFYCFYKNT